MAEKDLENAEKALAYFVAARRRAAAQLASDFAQGISRSTDPAYAEAFAKLQHGVEAAKAAVEEEQTDPEYLQELNERIVNGL